MKDTFTPENYVVTVQRAFAPVVAEGQLQVGDTEYAASHFGNFVVVFNGPLVRLKVTRDRMQFLVDFAPPASEEWIDDDAIWHLLGAGDVAEERARQELRSLEQVAQATAAHFASIRQLFTAREAPETLRRANEYRAARAKRLFGYSPSVSDGV